MGGTAPRPRVPVLASPVPVSSAPASPAGPEAPRGDVLYQRRPRAAVAALVALALSAFAFVTTEDLPVGLLQVISASLKASVSSVGLLVSVYAGTVVVISAPLAHLTKHVPRRLLLCVLQGAFVLTTLASAAADNYWLLLGSRVMTATAQGLFWAVVVVTAVGLFPPRARTKAVAGVTAGSSLAVVLGVPTGYLARPARGMEVAFPRPERVRPGQPSGRRHLAANGQALRKPRLRRVPA